MTSTETVCLRPVLAVGLIAILDPVREPGSAWRWGRAPACLLVLTWGSRAAGPGVPLLAGEGGSERAAAREVQGVMPSQRSRGDGCGATCSRGRRSGNTAGRARASKRVIM